MLFIYKFRMAMTLVFAMLFIYKFRIPMTLVFAMLFIYKFRMYLQFAMLFIYKFRILDSSLPCSLFISLEYYDSSIYHALYL